MPADGNGRREWQAQDCALLVLMNITQIARRLTLVLATFGVACGSPTAPSSSMPATSLAVAGPTNLTPGAAGTLFQALATLSNGTISVVTSGVTWQSTNSTVASVSSTGLVTAVAVGTTTITATYQGKSASLSVSVAASIPIASCGTYTGPGPFTVGANLSSQTISCLSFSGNTSAQLNCQGHDVASISLAGVRGFAIRNCVMHGTAALPSGSESGALQNLTVTSSSGVTVDSSDVLGVILLQACQGCTLSNSRFAYPPAGFATSSGGIAAEVFFEGGQGNQIIQNTIDGGWNGSRAAYGTQGCDDGVGMSNDAGLLIQGNSIQNVYDAGIEAYVSTPPAIVTATIQNNRITNAGYAGIGGYYVQGWQNSVFSGNIVTNSPTLLHFDVEVGPQNGVSMTTLVNNQFLNNVLMSPVALPPQFGGVNTVSFYINYFGGGVPYNVTGNLVQGNNFGTSPLGPALLPKAGFIDGGGNICNPDNSPANGLTCLGSSLSGLSINPRRPQ
jgi:hypothetical protein